MQDSWLRNEGCRFVVLLAAAALPVITVPRSAYRASLADARQRIGPRDPDDVDLLALAIEFNLAVWSNDDYFDNTGVVWYTTASVLATLESQGESFLSGR